ncbi:hypothetical protein C8R43DRAFT_961662 [Mycena crocata]|nr:hypothetical protein C8R43DRAFT_961662 [Mycena crocata]
MTTPAAITCFCERPVRIHISNTTANPGREFEKCATDQCGYWLVLLLPIGSDWARTLLPISLMALALECFSHREAQNNILAYWQEFYLFRFCRNSGEVLLFTVEKARSDPNVARQRGNRRHLAGTRCACNRVVRVLTAGARALPHNYGRPFARCAHPENAERCGFFEWCDGLSSQELFNEYMDARLVSF